MIDVIDDVRFWFHGILLRVFNRLVNWTRYEDEPNVCHACGAPFDAEAELSDIIDDARMSTGKGFIGWGTSLMSGDEKLLRRLWTHQHTTPFETGGGLKVEVQAPIFVFREWHRHRTMSYNEMSGRYAVLPDLYYIPSLERIMAGKQSKTNKQGSEAGFDESTAAAIALDIRNAVASSRKLYEQFIQFDVAREVARVVLPVTQYSRMRASANLWNWLRFLKLRMAPDAQWEIRQFANVVGTIVSEYFPRTWTLFQEVKA